MAVAGIIGTSAPVSNSTFVWTVPGSNISSIAGSNVISLPVSGTANPGSLYISTTNSNFSIGYNNFTIEGWYNIQTQQWTNNCMWTLFDGSTRAATQYYQLYLAGSNYFLKYNGSAQKFVSGYTEANNSWIHVALVRSGDTVSGGTGALTLYRNGTSILNVPLSGTGTGTDSIVNISTANTLYVGSSPANSTYSYGSWQGYISDFRFTNTAVYTGNFSPPPRGVVTTSNNGAPNTATFSTTATLSLVKSVSGAVVDTVGSTVTTGNSTTVGVAGLGGTISHPNVAASWTFGGTSSITTVTGSPYYALGKLFTIETWVYPTTFTGTPRVICQSNSTNSIDIALTTTGYVTCCNGLFTTTTLPMTASNWYHVAVVCANGVPSVYINGTSATLTGTTSGVNITDAANTIQIGAGPSTLTKFTGQIGGVRILKGTALYTANFTKPSSHFTNIPNSVMVIAPDYSTQDFSYVAANTTATNITYSTTLKPF